MSIKMIVAVDENNAIGYKDKLLFHIPADMKFFKKMTTQKGTDERYKEPMVIMGRKTYESIGKFLPDRINIVVTRSVENSNISDPMENTFVDLYYIRYLLQMDKSQRKNRPIWIIGGESIYRQMLDLTDEVYMTIVSTKVENADAYFPDISKEFTNVETLEDGFCNNLSYKMTRWVRNN